MSRPVKDKQTISLLPSIVIFAFIVSYIVSGYFMLDESTRLVPLLAGIVTLVLLILDMLMTRFGAGGDRETEQAEGGGVIVPESRGRELTAILFVAGGVAGIYLVGFLISIPLYLFASIAYLGNQSTKIALIVALVASLLIYLLFEVALDYQLFPGVLFS